MGNLDALFSDVTKALTVIAALVLLTAVLVIITLAIVLLVKFGQIPPATKGLVLAAVAVVALMVAVLVGWVAESQVLAAYGGLTGYALHITRWWDGFNRQHPIIGVLLLCATFFLLWPTTRDENDLDLD